MSIFITTLADLQAWEAMMLSFSTYCFCQVFRMWADGEGRLLPKPKPKLKLPKLNWRKKKDAETEA